MENRRKNIWTAFCGLLQIIGGTIGLGRLLLADFKKAAFHFCLSVIAGFLIGFPILFESMSEEMGPLAELLLSGTVSLEQLRIAGIIVIVLNLVLSVIDGVLLIIKGLKKFSVGLSLLVAVGVHILMLAMIAGTLSVTLNTKLIKTIYIDQEEPTTYESSDNMWIDSHKFDGDKLTYTVTSSVDLTVFIVTVLGSDDIISYEIKNNLKANEIYTFTFDITEKDFIDNNYTIETGAMSY